MPRTSLNFKCAYVYLAGSIDFASDGGVGWRKDLSKKLVDLGIPLYHILSPTHKPSNNLDAHLSNESRRLARFRKNQNWDKHDDLMGKIAHLDLRLIDKSDFVIAHFSADNQGNRVPAYMTIHEIVVAREQQKPVLVVWDGGKKSCSGYIMWIVGHKHVFASFDEMLNYLKGIFSGRVPRDAKDWLLLDFQKKAIERESVSNIQKEK
jgi:hypothetical protein